MIDLLVAGGGPAGLATAIHGARAGLEVVVVERRGGPLDKACGEGLMPHAVARLHRLGVQAPGRQLNGISYVDGKRCAKAQFRTWPGLGVRRTALHAALLNAATETGVRLVHADVGEVSQDDSSVRIGAFRARYLAAADGLHSPIRASLGLAQPASGPRRWGIRRHIQIAPWSDHVEVHWSADAEAYVTPVGDDCVGIAILTSQRGRFEQHLEAFPELRDRLHNHAHGPDRAAGPLRQNVLSRTAGRVLLVGDAAGYVDALTGEGLGIAFGGAELLVGCVVAGRPGDYERQWRQMSRRYRFLTAAVLRATAYPPVRTHVVQAAASLPEVFSRIVNLLAV